MATKKRKIEVHRLTLSGLPEGSSYSKFITDVRKSVGGLPDLVFEHGEKSHVLKEAYVRNHRLRLRFMSYATGFRPDVFDTEEYELSPNPLKSTQTGVDWTHVLGGVVGKRFVLLIERVQSGIYPTTIEGYLQWMIDEHHESPEEIDRSAGDGEPVTVSIEPEPGDEFVKRVDSLSRITKVTVRTVRPNPGWRDLEKELGREAEDSDAHKADVTMTARRNQTLSKKSGIVAAIKSLFSTKDLDYAAVEGEKDERKEKFSTERLGRYSYLRLEQDDRGQVVARDVWLKLSRMMDELD